jgi:hypothetical protein
VWHGAASISRLVDDRGKNINMLIIEQVMPLVKKAAKAKGS